MVEREPSTPTLVVAPPPAERRGPGRHTPRGALEVATLPDIMLNGVSLELSRLQSLILAALLEGKPLTTSQIAEIAWPGRFVEEHTVHSQVALLRKCMRPYGLRITNVRRSGYVLE